jgi:hypothetical protein
VIFNRLLINLPGRVYKGHQVMRSRSRIKFQNNAIVTLKIYGYDNKVIVILPLISYRLLIIVPGHCNEFYNSVRLPHLLRASYSHVRISWGLDRHPTRFDTYHWLDKSLFPFFVLFASKLSAVSCSEITLYIKLLILQSSLFVHLTQAVAALQYLHPSKRERNPSKKTVSKEVSQKKTISKKA